MTTPPNDVPDLAIRPMRPADVPAAERLSAEGSTRLDGRMFRRSWPDPELRSEARAAGWVARTRHLLETDPGGCWVAEDRSGPVGVVTSFNREVGAGDLRRPPGPAGPRDRSRASPPRSTTGEAAARHAVVVRGPQGGTSYRMAGSRCTRRCS